MSQLFGTPSSANAKVGAPGLALKPTSRKQHEHNPDGAEPPSDEHHRDQPVGGRLPVLAALRQTESGRKVHRGRRRQHRKREQEPQRPLEREASPQHKSRDQDQPRIARQDARETWIGPPGQLGVGRWCAITGLERRLDAAAYTVRSQPSSPTGGEKQVQDGQPDRFVVPLFGCATRPPGSCSRP